MVDLNSDGMPTRDPIEIAGDAEVSLFRARQGSVRGTVLACIAPVRP
jgi:hypothetical protein